MNTHKHPIETVKQFHMTFNHPIILSPKIPSAQRCELRYNLLNEELKELKQAIDNNDLVEIADALADLQYVLSGAILEFGFTELFYPIFAEVHRSNMSKACSTEAEAIATMEKAEKETGKDHHYVQMAVGANELKYYVYRTHDMKTVKSINYSPADIRSIIQAVTSSQ
jgi:predicted HAD superfamily Cof-like phosphohydrolase